MVRSFADAAQAAVERRKIAFSAKVLHTHSVYSAILTIHSLMRYVVLVAGIVAIARAIKGVSRGLPFTKADNQAGLAFLISADLQLLLGLLLYGVLSPITKIAFSNFGAAMKDRLVRFFAVEHVFAMVVAIALVHIARARVRRASTDADKHRRARTTYLLALIVMLAGIPWPFMPFGRGWIP